MQHNIRAGTLLMAVFVVITISGNIQAIPFLADTATINKKMSAADYFVARDPAKAIKLFAETEKLSMESGYTQGIIRSETGAAGALFTMTEYAKALDILQKARQLAVEGHYPALEANIRRWMIRIYIPINRLGMAGSELDTIHPFVFSGKDTSLMINWYSLKSRILCNKDDIAGAMQYADSAQVLAAGSSDAAMMAMVDYTIANIFFERGDYPRARNYYMQSIACYEKLNLKALLLPLYTNVMTTYQEEKKYDTAMVYIDTLANLQRQLDSKTGMLTTGRNKARLLVEMGQYTAAKKQTEENLHMCRQFTADSTYDIYWMGIVYRGLERYDTAAVYIRRAYDLALADRNWGRCAFYAHALYQTYYWKDHYAQALEWYQHYRQFNDSVNNARQQETIRVYTARFETMEKEKEIARLETESQINRLKRDRLVGLLAIVVLTSGMLLVYLVSRNRRNRRIYEGERSLAEARQRQATLKHALLEKDLDMKKQELASGMLLIARKNDFLTGLKEEIRKQVPEMTPGMRRILRNIQEEIDSEEEWDAFIRSFRDVHPSYMKKLSVVNSGLSKSETRLACLLKMNLSSKEIANMLNISSEGIKKARYRLRKKLGLETDTDLQEYLLRLE